MKLPPDSPDRSITSRSSEVSRAYTVLLAEDEELLRGVTALVLRRAGYQVLEAATTNAAHDAAAHSDCPVDLLIADIGLPQIGGMRLFHELANSDPEMKAVFISGYTQAMVCDVPQLPPGTTFLEKPFEPTALLEIISQLLVR
jgi:hypothetical protein